MAVTITSNLTQLDSCDSNTGWNAGDTYSGFHREGTACLGDQISTSVTYFTKTITSTDLSNKIIYVWMKMANPESLANGGYRFALGDGTNSRGYYIGGYDTEVFSRQGWFRFLIDTGNPPSNYDQRSGSSAPNFSAITEIGVGGIQQTKAVGNSPNFFWDSIDYVANNSYALLIGGGTSSNPGTFEEIVTEDVSTSNGWGIVRKIQPGVYGIQGAIRFGDGGTSDSYFEDKDAVVIFENPAVSISSSYYVLDLIGNSTGTNSFILGSKVGSGDSATGSNGCTVQSSGPNVKIDFSASNFDTVKIYGSKLYKVKTGVTLASNTSHEFIGNTVDQCAQVVANTTIIRGCTFSGYTSDTDGALLWNSSIDIKNCVFQANTDATNDPHAIEHPAAATVTYDNLTFSGNDYDINFTASSGDLTINATNGSNPSTYEKSGTGSVTINNAVVLKVTVKDSNDDPISTVQTAIYKVSDDTELMNKDTDVNGVASTTYNYTSDTDVYIRVRKSSTGTTRYRSTSATGTITTAGLNVVIRMEQDSIVSS